MSGPLTPTLGRSTRMVNTPKHDQQMEKALAVGTRDAVLYYHAGAIEAACGKNAEAIRYWQQSLDLNPSSDVSDAARRALNPSGKYTAVRYSR